ncbi:MAG: penicillin-binding protein 2 [Gemmatimonadetes bacterium]|nr:penicillin-binding protein 2 [Gemmatimonadota bacterium]
MRSSFFLKSAPPFDAVSRNYKARIARWVLGAAFCVLILAFFRAQILRVREYREKSLANKVRILPLTAPRGFIYDRDGEILTENLPAYSASLLPASAATLARSMAVAGPVLGLTPDEVRELLKQGRVAPGQPILLDNNLDYRTLSNLEERRNEIPGLLIQYKPKRVYPFGPETAHVLGYVGQISEEELKESRPAYAPGDLIGQGGLELRYERELRGSKGAEYQEVDALGRLVGPYGANSFQAPTRGRDLHLTIDLDLQRAAAEAFPDSMKGAVIAIDPRNGDLLLLYSSPTYDPNLFSGRISRSTWESVVQNPERPLYNRAIQSRYPPGSTFKLAVAAMALELGEATADTRMPVPCRGGYQFGRRWFGCWRPGGHGSLNLMQAIAQSCDGYFYQLGLRLGLDQFTRHLVAWGFNAETGIDLHEERAGIVPTSAEWFDERYGKSGWGPGVILNLAIGQGEISQTPLKMAQFYAALVNGGDLLQPRLLRDERDPGSRTLVGKLPLSHANLAVLQEALAAVAMSPFGTAYAATHRTPLRYSMGGKTGTAQFVGEEDYGWFVGYGPVEDPRIVVALVVEEGQHGSTVAPIVKTLVETYLDEVGAPTLEALAEDGLAPRAVSAP